MMLASLGNINKMYFTKKYFLRPILPGKNENQSENRSEYANVASPMTFSCAQVCELSF